MKLRTKLFIVLSILFVVFAVIVWFFTHLESQKINERWGAKLVQKQIAFDKYRTLSPIIHDISLIEELAQEPAIIAMALHEDDARVRENGLKILEDYKIRFQDRSYFVAFTQSRNYYFNDNNNTYRDKNPLYQVSPEEGRDSWFFRTSSLKEGLEINIDKDRFLGVTKVWINYAIKNHGKVIGVIGTGFDFDQFLKNSIGFYQAGGESNFVKKDLSIQLAKDPQMIDYNGFVKKEGKSETITSIITDPEDIKRIKTSMKELEEADNPSLTKTLWVTVRGQKYLLGIAYTSEIHWYSFTLFHGDELSLVDNQTIFIVMSLLFLIAMGVLGFRLKQGVVFPIEQLIHNIDRVQRWDTSESFPIVGSGEIAELSKRFNDLVKEIKEHHATLEQKIQARTEELMASEAKLQALAFYDVLTNLPNRRLFSDRLIQAQNKSKRSGLYGAVLFLDLDNFKPLNDTYGHAIGDSLLVEVAHRIRTCVREIDTIARFGGDEFVVLLSELEADKQESREKAMRVGEKIRQSLSYPYFLKISSDVLEEVVVEHQCTASIGLTLFIDYEVTQDEVLIQADSAMYEAKEQGRNTIVAYR
jgi:diguanylate cyclase (GGDEF)-like protein